jgi:hypothetical protein
MGIMSIKDHGIVRKTRIRLGRYGWLSLLHLACMRLVNRIVHFRILRGLYVESVNLAFLACPPRYRGGFAARETLERFAQDPEAQLSPAFVPKALQAGDECYALCEGDQVASYGWCSTRPTPLDPDELELHFSPDYVYRYKGFTAPRCRGQRLHAIGMTRTLRHYLGKGYRGLLCYVESTNLASLKSCERIGYRRFGSVYLVRLFGRYFSFSSPGCRRFDFRVQYTAPRAVIGQSASTTPSRTQTYQS